MAKRQSFSRGFKLEAVRLLERGKKPAADLARELGIRRNQRYKWRNELHARDPETAVPGRGTDRDDKRHR